MFTSADDGVRWLRYANNGEFLEKVVQSSKARHGELVVVRH